MKIIRNQNLTKNNLLFWFVGGSSKYLLEQLSCSQIIVKSSFELSYDQRFINPKIDYSFKRNFYFSYCFLKACVVVFSKWFDLILKFLLNNYCDVSLEREWKGSSDGKLVPILLLYFIYTSFGHLCSFSILISNHVFSF